MDWTEPLILLWSMEADVEHELHERFADDHVAGEWFFPGPEMRLWLAGPVV